ncbi:hypothetical protein CBER1_05067 [Cercospora berteroae]|uniref:Uncharacterized protein n=1 Tax=Cercospora berteroae TaxID=357750 RepID=A0A2S6BRK4_9PEZI|nr:hypothetical protein CBER1_05067 [Cercospora berteroae]
MFRLNSIAGLTLATITSLSTTVTAENLGSWSSSIPFPLVPTAIAVLPSGKLLAWASGRKHTHSIGQFGLTWSATWDPKTGEISELLVNNTHHDMFCPGISTGFDGTVVVTGGSTAKKVSMHAEATNGFYEAPEMQIARAYQSQVTLTDGRIFTIGGSWSSIIIGPGSGEEGNKTGEVYDPATNEWTILEGCPADPMQTADREGAYRSDNHAWLMSWKDRSVFQAGPSRNMNWYYTAGQGSHAAAGKRDDIDAMCGVFQMYDATTGSIFTAGGAKDYEEAEALDHAHIINIDAPSGEAKVRRLPSMNRARVFANAVTMPNGQVMILGGQAYSRPFSDYRAVTVPELFDPATERFTLLPDPGTARGYHSTAALLPDGTIFSGGGGLCSQCAKEENHLDFQIYTPPYLLEEDGKTLAARPTITDVHSKTVRVGDEVRFKVQKPDRVKKGEITAAMLRLGTATHSVDTDSRRIPLNDHGENEDGSRSYRLPSDAGVMLPGTYMLFAMVHGVPSEAVMIKVNP